MKGFKYCKYIIDNPEVFHYDPAMILQLFQKKHCIIGILQILEFYLGSRIKSFKCNHYNDASDKVQSIVLNVLIIHEALLGVLKWEFDEYVLHKNSKASLISTTAGKCIRLLWTSFYINSFQNILKISVNRNQHTENTDNQVDILGRKISHMSMMKEMDVDVACEAASILSPFFENMRTKAPAEKCAEFVLNAVYQAVGPLLCRSFMEFSPSIREFIDASSFVRYSLLPNVSS